MKTYRVRKETTLYICSSVSAKNNNNRGQIEGCAAPTYLLIKIGNKWFPRCSFCLERTNLVAEHLGMEL